MGVGIILIVLAAASAGMFLLERAGLRTTLTLTMKGDVKRETRFLAQYGQLICTFLTALLIWQLDLRRGMRICQALWTAVIGVTILATVTKRLLGRVRPRCEQAGKFEAGKFLGPSWKHANYRESFPSSHSASAVAYSVVLAAAYPRAAITFWTLGLICSGLRYIMDAHWPSDVLSGITLGLAWGLVSLRIFHLG